MPNKELVNVIKWRDDPASQKVLERIDKLQDRAARLQKRIDGLQTITRALQQQWSDLDSAGNRAGNALEDQASSAQRAERALKELEAEVKKTDKALDDLEEPRTVTVKTDKDALERARLYGDVESRTRAITGAVGYLGGTEFEHVANVGAELLAVNEAAGLLREELPKLVAQWGLTGEKLAVLGATGITTAAALVLVDKALDQIEEGSQRVRAAAEAEMDASERYHSFIQDATRQSLTDEVESINKRLAANRAFYEDLVLLENRAQEALDQGRGLNTDGISEAVLKIYDALGGDPAALDKIRERREEVEKTLDTDQKYFDRLVEAMISGATAANDAAIEQEQATDRLIASYERQAQNTVNAANQIADSSSESIAARLASIEAEKAATETLIAQLEPLAGDSEEAATKLSEARDNLFVLNEETERLTNVVLPAVQAREAEARALERVNELTKARHELIKQETTAQEKAAQDLEKAAQLAASYADQTEQVEAKRRLQEQRDEADFQRQRARDIANHYADLADIDAKYYESVADTLADLADDVNTIDQQKVKELADQNKEMQRLAKDHNKRMLQIARDLDISQQDAVEERDVSAAIRNARQAQEQARDENEQYEDEKDRREDDFEDRLKELDEQRAEKQKRGQQALQDLKMQHQKERQQNIAAFNAEIALENQERRIKLQRQQEDYRNEDLARAKHYANQARSYNDHFDDLEDIVDTGFENIKSKVQSVMNAIAGSTSTPLTVSGGGSARYVSADGRAKKYGTGGKLLPDQWVILGDTGAEMAKFNRDGSWEALNPRKTQQALSQSISLSVPVQIYDASSPAMIESVFEQRVIPKLITAVRQAAPQRAG